MNNNNMVATATVVGNTTKPRDLSNAPALRSEHGGDEERSVPTGRMKPQIDEERGGIHPMSMRYGVQDDKVSSSHEDLSGSGELSQLNYHRRSTGSTATSVPGVQEGGILHPIDLISSSTNTSSEDGESYTDPGGGDCANDCTAPSMSLENGGLCPKPRDLSSGNTVNSDHGGDQRNDLSGNIMPQSGEVRGELRPKSRDLSSGNTVNSDHGGDQRNDLSGNIMPQSGEVRGELRPKSRDL